ncbi:hypothetical protein PspLS_08960 [Pyricularia sp. CBS 133598]|nr:hypothetical protein PspLS_08960 [Pyricularia sp. CBS 133598]
MATNNGSAEERNTPSPSSRPGNMLQAAATMNAGLQHENCRGSSTGSLSRNSLHAPHGRRRRSSILMNLQLNDPSLPAPGEMVADQNGSSLHMPPSPRSPIMIGRDPLNRHGRQPSLGEIHQEFEAETEAHVNRLLQVIRDQQIQLQQAQAQGHLPHVATGDDVAIQSGPPSSSLPSAAPASSMHPRSPVQAQHRGSFDFTRGDMTQRTPSYTASPRLRSTSISGDSEHMALGGRDESAFYQAETQMLTRENQMLRHRIRDLERQLGELGSSPGAAAVPHEPFQHSHLTQSTSAAEEDSVNATESLAGVAAVSPLVADGIGK